MDKVTKRVLFVLIIVALALPIFVGCEPEPAVDYEAEFLTILRTESGKIKSDVAEVTISGHNITVDLKKLSKGDVEPEVQSLVGTLKGKTSSGTTLSIAGKTYTLHDPSFDLVALGKDVKDNLDGQNKISYTAKVIYSGNTINLSGTIKFTGLDL